MKKERIYTLFETLSLAAELHLITVHRDTYHYYYMTVFLRFVLL